MKKSVHFMILFLLGMLVYFIGGYYTGISYLGRTMIKIALPILFLGTTYYCRRNENFKQWEKISVGFLAASTGFLITGLFSSPLLKYFGIAADNPSGIAITKFSESFFIVVPALIVARLGGMTFPDLYIRRGKLKLWLISGLVTFFSFFVLHLLQAYDQGVTNSKLIAYAPWTLLFIFSNAFMEELHFRGLLLKSFESILGRHGSNLCIAIFFTLVHAPVQYTPDIISFLAILFVLAYAWGYVIQRTESIWGSVLFHAGADLMIIIGIYQVQMAG